MPSFAASPELEFTYFLADRLKMTVAEMQQTMSNTEFVYWMVYHGRRAQQQEMASKKGARGGR